MTWSRVTGGLVRKMSRACRRWSPVNGIPDTLENLEALIFGSFWLSVIIYSCCFYLLWSYSLNSTHLSKMSPTLSLLVSHAGWGEFTFSQNCFQNPGWLRIIGWKIKSAHLKREDLLDPYEMSPGRRSIGAATYGEAEAQGVSLDFHLDKDQIKTRFWKVGDQPGLECEIIFIYGRLCWRTNSKCPRISCSVQ